MNSPLKAFNNAEPAKVPPDRKKANVVSIKTGTNRLIKSFTASPVAVALGDFNHRSDNRDSKALDYLLIGILSILVHTAAVEYFKNSQLEEEKIEEVKAPPKVQISFVRPQPKPAVEPPPPPPPPKVVALKKPPKPKVKPKPAPRVEQPPPVQSTNTVTEAPKVSAPPPPPPPKVEKVTQPRAGAGYLNNPPPVYPELAMDNGWEGKVLMKVHVLANGKPDSVSVVKSSGKPVLDSEAVRTVKKWSFVPAKRGETPIDGWVTIPISFNLHG